MLPVHDCNAAQLLGSGRARGGPPAAGDRGTRAMAKMPGLLRQRQKIDEAELERDQTRVAARLADIFGGSAASAPDDPSQADAPAEATSAGPATSTAEPPAADGGVRGKRRGRSRPAIVVELGPVGVADTTETDASGDDAANHDGVPEPAGTPMVGVMAGPGSTVAAGPGAEWWSAAVDYALIGQHAGRTTRPTRTAGRHGRRPTRTTRPGRPAASTQPKWPTRSPRPPRPMPRPPTLKTRSARRPRPTRPIGMSLLRSRVPQHRARPTAPRRPPVHSRSMRSTHGRRPHRTTRPRLRTVARPPSH